MEKCLAFESIYNKQVKFQNGLVEKGLYSFESEKLPKDNIRGFSYHIQQLMSEIGEILNSDKRWKSHRNDKMDLQNKKEEIADCFIVLMNVAIFSGLSANDLEVAIIEKMDENAKRVQSL